MFTPQTEAALLVHTELAEVEFQDGDWIVRHVFRVSDDGRRTTDFYLCGSQQRATVLKTALLRKHNLDLSETLP